MKNINSGLTLVADGKSSYEIRIPAIASDKIHKEIPDEEKGNKITITNESEAARALSEVIAAMTGVTLPITEATEENETEYEILVGKTVREADDLSALGNDGFVVKNCGSRIFLEGNSEQSIWDAVTYFCRELLGYDVYTMPEVPSRPVLEIADAFFCEFKRNVVQPAVPETVAAFERTGNGSVDYAAIMEDSIHYMSRSFPESICFSDERTIERMLGKSRRCSVNKTPRMIFHHPAPLCRCSKCRAAAKEDGTPAAAYFRMAEIVAKALKEEYPKVKLEILAYASTLKPPKRKLPDNIRVYVACEKLSSSHAINDPACPANAAFARTLRAWTKVADDVEVIDFTSDYFYYPITFPNFDIVRKNIRFYASIGLKGVFLQWDERQASLEFGPMRKILFDALLANPKMSDAAYQRTMKQALEIAYGTQNAEPMMEYIALMTQASATEFDILTTPEVLLPVTRTPADNIGHFHYDLSVVQKAYDLWNGMHPYQEVLSTSRVYLAQMLFSRYQSQPEAYAMVQFGEWYTRVIDNMDKSRVEAELFSTQTM